MSSSPHSGSWTTASFQPWYDTMCCFRFLLYPNSLPQMEHRKSFFILCRLARWPRKSLSWRNPLPHRGHRYWKRPLCTVASCSLRLWRELSALPQAKQWNILPAIEYRLAGSWRCNIASRAWNRKTKLLQCKTMQPVSLLWQHVTSVHNTRMVILPDKINTLNPNGTNFLLDYNKVQHSMTTSTITLKTLHSL